MNKKYIVSKIAIVIAISALASSNVDAFYLGQRGQEVIDLQGALLESGYDIPAISSGVARPGYFGVQTQKALATYEASKASSLKLGAVSNPDLQSQFFSFGNVREWKYKDTELTRAASTTCSFQLPPATTTLMFPGVVADLSTIASTTVFEIGYDPVSAYATTTLIARKTITAGTKDTVMASTTWGGNGLNNLTPPGVFAPNGFINFKIGGGSIAGTNDPAGICSVHAREVR